MVASGTFIEGKPAGSDFIEMTVAAFGANKPIWPLGLK